MLVISASIVNAASWWTFKVVLSPPYVRNSTYGAMVTNRKLTIETLTKLGARKLTELLIAEAAGNRRLKQTLNLATSTQDGPAALAAILRRRLVTLAKSRSTLPYDKGRELIAELDGLRTTIIETIAVKDSRLAFELL
jgi:hypothetical protein